MNLRNFEEVFDKLDSKREQNYMTKRRQAKIKNICINK